MQIVVLDTNVLVHFRRPDDPGWRDVFAGALRFVVPPTALAELDEHKTSPDGKVRKRARAILPWLEENNGVDVADGVTLELLATEPHQKLFEEHHLDPGMPDDRIVAAAVGLVAPGADVILLTDDTTPRLKAKKCSLKAMAPPESLRLAETPSQEESELAELRRQVSAMSNRIPKLRLTTPLHVLALGPDESDQRDQHIAVGMARMQESIPPHPLQALGMSNVIPGYSERYRVYLESTRDYADYLARCVKVPLELENAGTGSGSALEIDLAWDAVAEFQEELPNPPERPRYGLIDRPLFDPFTHLPLAFRNADVSGPDGVVGGYTCSYRAKGLLHQRSLELDPLLLYFPRIDGIGGIALRWEIHCEELPGAARGELHLKISTERSVDEMLRMTRDTENGA